MPSSPRRWLSRRFRDRIIFLLVEKRTASSVSRHASTLLFIGLVLINVVLNIIPILGF